ncbi:ferrichrome ABC transporter substrate-binding protein, partial [Enterococcus faecalis]|nr:ferrichrome ABC transporter substrate-binding protein [Enterococcus faecalis]
ISYDFPYEAVLLFEPDLFLNSSSALVEGGKYKEYSKIAPTYVVKNGENVNWTYQLEDIATVLDKKEQVKIVLEDDDTLTKCVQ